jgi:hypothetical protein
MIILVEHLVSKKKTERDQLYGNNGSNDTNNDDHDTDLLRTNLIARMKSLTNASEDVCVSILQRHSYDLETSVETYLSNSYSHNN